MFSQCQNNIPSGYGERVIVYFFKKKEVLGLPNPDLIVGKLLRVAIISHLQSA